MFLDSGFFLHLYWALEKAQQSVKKVEVQEALPPAGVIGAEPLALVPQHFPPQTSLRVRSTEDEDGPKGCRRP